MVQSLEFQRFTVSSALVSLLGPVAVFAQSPLANNALRDISSPAIIDFGAVPTTTLSAPRGGGAEVFLLAGADETTGVATFGWKDGQGHFRLLMKGPLNKGTKEAQPLDLEGLGSGTSREFSAHRLNWRGPSEEEQAEYTDLCLTHAKAPTCDISDLPQSLRPRARRLQHLTDTPWLVGVSGSISRTTFDYQDPPLSSQSANETSWSGIARLGYYTEAFGFIIGRYSQKRAFHPGSGPTELCSPLSGTESLTCSDVVLRKPIANSARAVSLEFRRGYGNGLALAPVISREMKAGGITTVTVPVYFLRTEKGGLSGGVKAGWQSDSRDVTIAVSVGTVFDLTSP